MADSKLDREFLRTVLSLAAKAEVDRLLLVSDVPLSAEHLRGRPLKKKLVYAVTEDRLAQSLRRQGYVCVTVPPYDYSRVEKVKVALVAAMTANVLADGENVLCLTGRSGARMPDTLIRLQLGGEFNPQVVEALVSLAMAIGHEGFEGHPIGTIFVLGDSTVVMEQSKQLTINPFQGISEAERNVLDPSIREAVKNFAVLDGAFVIREDGVVLAAGRYLQASAVSDRKDVELPLGLGARHAAAAAVTVETRAISISVSRSSGTVRVCKNGDPVLELQQVAVLEDADGAGGLGDADGDGSRLHGDRRRRGVAGAQPEGQLDILAIRHRARLQIAARGEHHAVFSDHERAVQHREVLHRLADAGVEHVALRLGDALERVDGELLALLHHHRRVPQHEDGPDGVPLESLVADGHRQRDQRLQHLGVELGPEPDGIDGRLLLEPAPDLQPDERVRHARAAAPGEAQHVLAVGQHVGGHGRDQGDLDLLD